MATGTRMNLAADSVQGAFFLATGQAQGDAFEIWQLLTADQKPEVFHRQPLPNLQSTAEGSYGDFGLTITSEVGRVDFFLTATGAANLAPGTAVRIENPHSAIYAVTNLLRLLAERYTPVRLAILIDLAKTIAPGDETRELLALMPPIGVPETSADVSLTLNVRRPFHCHSNYIMNRMIVWGSGQVGFVMVGSNDEPVFSPYVGVKVDINTSPEITIDPEDADSVLRELTWEVEQMLEQGITKLWS